MTKYILASATALTLLIAPAVSMAQTNNGSDTSSGTSQKMKGPPNADGMQKSGSSDDMKAGRSEDSNGAAAAKSTGADKK